MFGMQPIEKHMHVYLEKNIHLNGMWKLHLKG